MNNKLIIGVVAAVLILGVGVFAFGSDDDSNDDSSTANTSSNTASTDELPFSFALDNLAPLESGVYEGWVVRGDDKTSFGTFNTNANGDIVGDLALEGITPQDGDTIAVSIEPVPDNDPGPSPTMILAGEIENDSANLAFPVDISEFAGKYILATPSNGDDTNETAGVWFLDLVDGMPSVGLDLPVAPEGWAYEGWVVYSGTPLTSGQFTDPAAADEFSGFTGPEGVPPFPGEDYLVNLPEGTETPVDLANGTSKVVISLEPRIDGEDPTGEGPAQIKPLVADVAEGAADHAAFDLMLDTSSLPSGSASL